MFKILASLLFVVAPESVHIRQLSSKHFLLERGEDLEHMAGDVDPWSAGVEVPQTVLQRGLLEPHHGRSHHGCRLIKT